MRLLACIAVLGFVARAEPDPATAHAPWNTLMLVRVKSLDRIDELGELRGLKELRRGRRWSDALLKGYGYRADAPVARDRPLYLAVTEPDPFLLVPAAKGAATDGYAARGGYLLAPRGKPADWQPRGEPMTLPPGDVAVVLRVAAVYDTLGHTLSFPGFTDDRIETMHAPFALKQALKLSSAYHRMAFRGIDELRYGLTVEGETLASRGRLVARPGTPVARGLVGVAEAARPARGLAAYLPRASVYLSESGGALAEAERRFMGVVDDYLGRDAGRCIHAVLSPAMLFRDRLTGRYASAVDIRNLLAPATMAVWEQKQQEADAPPLAALDVAPLNARLKELEIPARFVWSPSIAKQAGVAIHRLQIELDDPRLAALASQRKFCLAETNGLLLTYGGVDAVGGIRRLISRCQAEPDADHPHLAALRRLAPRGCHGGLSFNLGAVKPAIRMLGAFVPSDAEAFQAILRKIPDELYMSTALRWERTAIHFTGDWPLKTALDVLETVDDG